MAQAVIYLALAPKSNAAYRAFGEARAMAAATGSLAPPKHILNAPTGLMKSMDTAEGINTTMMTATVFPVRITFRMELNAASFTFRSNAEPKGILPSVLPTSSSFGKEKGQGPDLSPAGRSG